MNPDFLSFVSWACAFFSAAFALKCFRAWEHKEKVELANYFPPDFKDSSVRLATHVQEDKSAQAWLNNLDCKIGGVLLGGALAGAASGPYAAQICFSTIFLTFAAQKETYMSFPRLLRYYQYKKDLTPEERAIRRFFLSCYITRRVKSAPFYFLAWGVNIAVIEYSYWQIPI